VVVFGLKNKNMITVKLRGGLGNQMFQYAFGRSLSIKKGENLTLDISSFNNTAIIDTKRKYLLDNFNIKPLISETDTFRSIDRFFWKVINNTGLFLKNDFHVHHHSFFNKIPFKKFDSYFQSYKYFEQYQEEIRKDFSLKIELPKKALEILNTIKNTNSVSLHVRRGDYVSNKKNANTYGSCSLDYYRNAISTICGKISNPVFFVFSDDIEWVKNELIIPTETIYVSQYYFDEVAELFLMSQCKNNIIENSSFSWWGAWLNNNKDKIVICPRKWTLISNFDTIDLIPDNWIKL
jgi:hypothetical protein